MSGGNSSLDQSVVKRVGRAYSPTRHFVRLALARDGVRYNHTACRNFCPSVSAVEIRHKSAPVFGANSKEPHPQRSMIDAEYREASRTGRIEDNHDLSRRSERRRRGTDVEHYWRRSAKRLAELIPYRLIEDHTIGCAAPLHSGHR